MVPYIGHHLTTPPQTPPAGKPDDDAWLGCLGNDPARGRARVAFSQARGATAAGGGSGGLRLSGFFSVVQPGRVPAAWERAAGGGAGGNQGAAEVAPAADADAPGRRQEREKMDAWIGHRMIPPWAGRRSATVGGAAPAAASAHLWGGVFRDAPPAGCWSDMPRIGAAPPPGEGGAQSLKQQSCLGVTCGPAALVLAARTLVCAHTRRALEG